MSPLSLRVRRTIRLRRLLAEGDRVVVAVSGGPDSVALLWVLRELERRGRWRLAGLVHVHHGLRGADSDADEAFCRALADRLALPIHVTRVDVAARARETRRSIEAAARAERYACFEQAVGAFGATAVATGHTQDDQAETVLLRLLRGAGGRGLSAIRPRRGPYVRPLIDSRRADVLADLAARGEPFREDRSNLDLDVPRNRLRHTVLPAMTEYWPGGIAALARFAELAADDEEFLTKTAEEVTSAVTLSAVGGVQVIDVRGLNALPAALGRRIVRAAIESAGGKPSFRDIEAVRQLARAEGTGGHLDLQGSTVERSGVALRFWAPRADEQLDPPFAYDLTIPGRAHVTEIDTIIQASWVEGTKGSQAIALGDAGTRATLQAGAVVPPLVVRNRRPGDRLRPFGAPGSRKLQDLLVDRRVPRNERDRLPIVVDATGRIVWVVGLTIAEECRVTTPESGVVVLESKKGNQ